MYWQFHRAANIYFVVIALVSCIPWVEAKWQPKVLTVVLILLAQALKDLYEDVKRWSDDKEVNTSLVDRFDAKTGTFKEVMWREVDAGDLCLITGGSTFPADTLVLASADQSGVFFVGTKSMDGETNLKERSVPSAVSELVASMSPASLRPTSTPGCETSVLAKQTHIAKMLLETGMEVHLEQPHPSVLDLDCSLSLGVEAPTGLNCNNFGLRGHSLENTRWVIGLACYVGGDTKLRLNSFPPPSKSSELERYLNRCVICILSFLFVVSAYFALASRLTGQTGLPLYKIFLKYLVILYPVLPMTLYIAFEVLHLVIGMQIERDPLMYDESTGMHAKARNTSVIEELGQVDFVFSDKTGTLTANEMRFAHCSVGRMSYGPFLPDAQGRRGPGHDQVARVLRKGQTPEAEELRSFFNALAVCHTVQVDEETGFCGESPDEVALVEAAKAAGCVLEGREAIAGAVVHRVRAPDCSLQENELRHVLAFNSDRKRMSVIVATADGGACVLTKGSDSVMEGLMSEPLPREAHAALSEFSRQGLRTLVVAKRQMSAADYAMWRSMWDEAGSEMEDRAGKLDAVAALAEVNLRYLGVTALEDRLQDSVPTTIAAMRKTGLRVWVLTGDKVETAIEIAKSCRLIDANMSLVTLVGAGSPGECMRILREAQATKLKGTQLARGMVLDGQSVSHILSDEATKTALYDMAIASSSCVCCRLSPLQKRELVELVRSQNPKAITLAIGDGANDVPMIQGAHVGIGVRGKEGAAAVQASDMAVSQFSFLGNIVLCHGRKAYRRISTFLLFFIYKSLTLGWSYIIYAHTMMFSGEGAYPQWLDVVWNPLTSCAVVLMLATDIDFPDKVALASPELYKPGPARKYFNPVVFGHWMLLATVQGTIAWCVPVYGLTTHHERVDRPLQEGGPFWQASFTAFTILFFVVHLKLILVAERPLQPVGIVAFVIELLLYLPVAMGLGSNLAPSHELVGAPRAILGSGPHLLVLVVAPLAAIAPEAVMSWYVRRYSDGEEADRLAYRGLTPRSDGETETDASLSESGSD